MEESCRILVWVSCKNDYILNFSTCDCECDICKIGEYSEITKNCTCKKHSSDELFLAYEEEISNRAKTTSIFDKKKKKNECVQKWTYI